MNLKRKNITAALILGLGMSGVLATTSTYAHYPYHPYYPHHHDHGGNIAAGLILGATLGVLAGTANADYHHHYWNCRRVYFTHYCSYNHWGRHCYTVRHVRYVC